MSATVINTIVTIISIVLTLLNGLFLYKTRRHEAEVFKKLKGLELLPYASRFHDIFSEISKKARLETWNQAGRNSKLIGELNDVLVDYSKIQAAVSDANIDDLKTKIESAYNIIDSFSEGHDYAKKNMLELLKGIDDVLQKEVDLFKIK